jgi:16S rRNA (cytidine1402-2'-O)-methyltransferase
VLVRRAVDAGINVVAIPGAAAFVNAVVVSGLPTDATFFGGFLPSKKGERRKRLEQVRDVPATLVFYEAPHRLARSLADCAEILGDRQAAIARELTKFHEQVVRGKLGELAGRYSTETVKGEIVLVIDRAHDGDSSPIAPDVGLGDRIKELETQGFERKAALKKAAKEFGMSKSEAYRLIESKKNDR